MDWFTSRWRASQKSGHDCSSRWHTVIIFLVGIIILPIPRQEVARAYTARVPQYKRWLDSLFFGRQRCTGQSPPVVGGEIVAPVTLGVCFPSGPSCFSSISDFTTPAVCLPYSSPSLVPPSSSFSSVTPRQQTPDNFPWLSSERLLKLFVDNMPPLTASLSICSRIKSAYRV